MDVNLARLEPLVGTWTAEGMTRDSVLGPGVPVRSTETFSWLDGGYFLVNGNFTEDGNRYRWAPWMHNRFQRA
jgi:hypothetical protein